MKASIGRRRFLASSTSAFALAGMGSLAASDVSPTGVRPEQLTIEHFAPHVGSKFKVTDATGNTVDAELVEVSAISQSGSRPIDLPRQEAFLIRLQSSKDVEIAEGVGDVANSRLGVLPLYLTPSCEGGVVAVFN